VIVRPAATSADAAAFSSLNRNTTAALLAVDADHVPPPTAPPEVTLVRLSAAATDTEPLPVPNEESRNVYPDGGVNEVDGVEDRSPIIVTVTPPAVGAVEDGLVWVELETVCANAHTALKSEER
jgi:hypothetical protein